MPNPKFIALHDWNSNNVEYVEITQVSRVEPEMFAIYEPVTKTDKSWLGKDQTYKVMELKEERMGSRIYMKNNKYHTCVSETPEEVMELIKGASNE